VDFRAVRLVGEGVAFEMPGMALTLDGIAKGFVVDRTVDTLVAGGADRVMVNAGGDIATGGSRSTSEPWTFAVQDPGDERRAAGLVQVGGGAIATSGDYLRSFSTDRAHHHILDPRTGRSPEEVSAVSVLAPDAMRADALSTALMVLGCGEGMRLVEATQGVEGMIIDKQGTRTRSHGFPPTAV
jgi:thiamine biosynthesis lipoprotein